MKQLFTFVVALIAYGAVHAQPVVDWQKTYGGNEYEVPGAVQPTPDGGIIVAGTTYSTDDDATGNKGIADILVIKLRANKTIEWKKTFGGSNDDGAHDIQLTSDGGYIIAGYTKSTDGDVSNFKGHTDFWIIKLRGDGSLQWQRTYGGTKQEVASSIKPLPAGGYIVCGYTTSNDMDVTNNHRNDTQDAWLLKLDNDGNITWQHCYGGTDAEFAYHIELAGNGYIFSGYAKSTNGDLQLNNGNQDVWIVKLSASGSIEWQRTMGGALNEVACEVKPIATGGYIAVGTTTSANGDVVGNHGTADVWAIRLGTDGSTVWSRCYGGSSLEAARSVTVTPTGQFIISGSAESNDHDVPQLHGRSDYWVLALNAAGDRDWQVNLGGSDVDDAMTACYTADGKLVIAGTSFSRDHDVTSWKDGGDIWLVQLKLNLPLPVITTQPKDTSVCASSGAGFSIVGTGIFNYQWQVLTNTVWVDLVDNGTYTGTRTNALLITDITSNIGSHYRCIVSNPYGSVTSTVAQALLLAKPIITMEPADITTCVGSSATLAVQAQYAEQYQWQQSTNRSSWQNINGATGASISVPVLAGGVSYRCEVSNRCNTSTSKTAVVTGSDCSIPNAFSPNSDGLNDTWIIPFLSDFTTCQVAVFDRYGSIVFESKGSYQPWNGMTTNKPLPFGTYYYVIDLQNKSKRLSGTITILR